VRALFRWPHRSRLASAARLPDAGRFDPEFSTRQPLFTVSDWAREPALQCKADGRKRVPLVTAEISQTAAIKVQMVLYPPGTKSASYRHEGAESFIYLLSGRGTAGTHDQSSGFKAEERAMNLVRRQFLCLTGAGLTSILAAAYRQG
jgi:hypothetical protein